MKLSPPVMLALLIQSIYNIVDSYFIARYAQSGLTALSLIFPIQLLMTALATGTGTGLSILISQMDGRGEIAKQRDTVKSGLILAAINFLLFACVATMVIGDFYRISSDQMLVQTMGIQYGKIIFFGSFGLFLESICTKMLQAKGNMVVPMAAQVVGALVNIILDPILIFGWRGVPSFGAAGAALATVAGQWIAMFITLGAVCRRFDLKGRFCVRECISIYRSSVPSIIMQSLYTLYIVGLNLILKQFTEDAVTVLGIYYKLQTFFFIPLMGLQQVVVPLISFFYGGGREKSARDTLKYAICFSLVVMLLGMAAFMLFPQRLIGIFSEEPNILLIGERALRIISLSFLPASFVMMFTVYFQGIDRGKSSIAITVLRQVLLLVPLAWLFHFWGLGFVWLTFPVTEMVAVIFCFILYRKRGVKA